jgi:predicted dehydrogenase
MAKLRAGLIGLGMMGRHHGRVLAGLDGVELVAVADPCGDPHGVAGSRPLLQSVEELIAAGIDYCMVAVPTIYHEPVGLALAEAGVHSMIEKPLAQDTPSARKLADAFAAKGLVGAVGHIERYNPALQSARARLEAGELGAVYQVTTRRQGPFPDRIADVGVVKDLATHDIDLTAWVTQQPFTSVSARTATKSGRAFEDLVAVTGLLDDGTVTNHLVNWLSPLKERKTIITGERGAFVADTLSADLTFYANGLVPTVWDDIAQFRGVSEGDVVRYAIAKPEPLRVEHEQFRDAVLGKEADIVTLEQGLATVVVAEAVIESARTGRTVEVACSEADQPTQHDRGQRNERDLEEVHLRSCVRVLERRLEGQAAELLQPRGDRQLSTRTRSRGTTCSWCS